MVDRLTKIPKEILDEILMRSMEDIQNNFQQNYVEDFLKGIPVKFSIGIHEVISDVLQKKVL